MRTTLALVLGMGAVLAAALWTARHLDPGSLADTLAGLARDAGAPTPAVDGPETAATPAAPARPPIPTPVPAAAPPSPPPAPAAKPSPPPVQVAEPVSRRVAGTVTEPFEEAPPAPGPPPLGSDAELDEPAWDEDEVATWAEDDARPWDEGPALAEADDAAFAASAPPADPGASASRIRRMLDVYRRTLRSGP